jgi:YidC/Oxa1 family membrane protein insertase
MDRKSIIVLIICGALFFAWSMLTPKLFPPKPGLHTNALFQATNALPSPAATGTTNLTPSTNAVPFVPPVPTAPEELLVLSNENTRVTFTSHGGGIKEIELLKYLESVACETKRGPARNRPASLNAQTQQPMLAISGSPELVGDGLYKIRKAAGTMSGTNQIPGAELVRAEKLLANQIYIVKEFSLGSNYLIYARVRFENRSGGPLALPSQQWIAGTATPLNPQDNEQKVGLMWYNGSKSRQADNNYFLNRGFACMAGTPRSEYRVSGEPVVWAVAQNQFFFLALMPETAGTEIVGTKFTLPPPPPEEIADAKAITNQFAIQAIVSQPGTNLAPGLVLEREFTIYAGPKAYRTLERISADMKNNIETVMGFGWFGFFSKVLLLSMNGLHAVGFNYALAIIAITVIIKLLFWPLTQASTRSMKRMQTLQPQMKAIQEKYKDDPAKMNRKMMEFMRENKVSPLGGCLPLFLQIPVFIGFFQMVQSAIELRGAKFLWACDLSRPDTVATLAGFNVNPLSLIMGLTMFWQARMTPPSPGMDPAQQKLMKYFPLIILFMLYNYSAGLTLYWTVQNLLSIAQMKLTRATESKAGAATKPAAPSMPSKKKS